MGLSEIESVSVKEYFLNCLGNYSLFAARTVSALRRSGKTRSIYSVWALLLIPLLGIFYTLLSNTLDIKTIQDIIAILLILVAGYFTFIFFMSIDAKWVVIGRHKPGRHPLDFPLEQSLR